MKKVVCVGGGSGQAALLKGLKQIDSIELSTIVAMADNGGSTGRLRDSLHLPAMGDIRNVMVALAEREDLMTAVMSYRFDSNSGDLSGHALGNIIISALAKESGDFLQAVTDLSGALRVKGKIYPSTLENVQLKARMKDGSIITGETELRDTNSEIEEVFYDGTVTTYPSVIQAIYDADYIIIGIGSLYTSILPNLIIDDIKVALANCKGKIIYYCNSMTEKGETSNYSCEDHVDAIERHIGKKVIDAIVVASDNIPEKCLKNYALEEALQVKLKEKKHDYKVFTYSLLNFKYDVIRHDPNKTRDSFIDIMRKI